MTKLYSYTYISLDGIASSPEKWISPYFSNELGANLAKRLQSCAAMVLGRQTYAEFSQFWPRQGSDVPFADLNNGVRKYVVSKTLNRVEWSNSTIVDVHELTQLKAKGDLHISGSGTLVRSLLKSRLLDEMVVVMCPLIRGQGGRLFDGIETTGLDLVSVTPFPRGVLSLTYRPMI